MRKEEETQHAYAPVSTIMCESTIPFFRVCTCICVCAYIYIHQYFYFIFLFMSMYIYIYVHAYVCVNVSNCPADQHPTPCARLDEFPILRLVQVDLYMMLGILNAGCFCAAPVPFGGMMCMILMLIFLIPNRTTAVIVLVFSISWVSTLLTCDLEDP